jgi:hypothetical protein
MRLNYLIVFIELCLCLGVEKYEADFNDLEISLYDAFKAIIPPGQRPSSPEGFFAVWKGDVFLPSYTELSKFGKRNDKVEIVLKRGNFKSLVLPILICNSFEVNRCWYKSKILRDSNIAC